MKRNIRSRPDYCRVKTAASNAYWCWLLVEGSRGILDSSRVVNAFADSQESACTLCKDGSSPSIPDQDLTPVIEAQGYADLLAMVGITQVSCRMVPGLLPLIPGGLNTTQCDTLQEMAGTLCGCPSSEPIPTSSPLATVAPAAAPSLPCDFCGGGVNPELSTKDISDAFLNFFPGLTCEHVGQVNLTLPSSQCSKIQEFLAEGCGCEHAPLLAPTFTPTASPVDSRPPTHSLMPQNDTIQDQSGKCSLCWDGSRPAFTDMDITKHLLGNAQSRKFVEDLELANVTCAQVDALIPLVSDKLDADTCGFVQSSLGGICGCPPVPNGCVFCPNDPVIPLPDGPFGFSRYYLDTALTCSETANALSQISQDDSVCFLGQLTNYVCGCNDGQRSYFGTESAGQRAALAWIPRISGTMSLLGSIYIVLDVLSRFRQKEGSSSTRSVYDRLMLSMAGFDVVTSVCWILSTAPIWKYDIYGSPSGVYGAIGTMATCKTQAYFFQLGAVASLFYNVALSVYYLLVIVYGMREAQVKKYSAHLVVPPIVLALAASFAGLPYYDNIQFVCSIPPPPQESSWAPIIALTLVPVAFCLVVATCIVIAIYLSVRQKIQASRRYDFARTQNRSAEASVGNVLPSNPEQAPEIDSNTQSRSWSSRWSWKRRSSSATTSSENKVLTTVFWQSFWYLAAFLISYPAWFTANVSGDSSSYQLWMAVAILTPLQGFMNFLVYARPRWIQYQAQRSKVRSHGTWFPWRSRGGEKKPELKHQSHLTSAVSSVLQNEHRSLDESDDNGFVENLDQSAACERSEGEKPVSDVDLASELVEI
jgi:hypothetical protein